MESASALQDHCDNVKVKSDKKSNFRRNEIHNTSKKTILQTKAYLAMKRCIDFIELFGKLLGWELNWKWKANPRHWCTCSCVAVVVLQCLYLELKHFIDGEYKSILRVFAVLGVAIIRMLEVKCYVKYVKELTAINYFSFKLCRQTFGKLADKLEDQQLRNLKLCKLCISMALASASAYVYHPIKSYIYNGELNSLLPIEIVFLDQSKISGFFIANAVMVVISIYSVFIAFYMGLHFVAAILNYSMQVDLIEADVTELDALWLNATTISVSERRSFLRNICQKCQDKDNYISEVKEIFDKTIYLFFCFSYISIIICLYLSEAENWIPGYAIANGLFIEMMFYCFVGTRVTVINERLCYIITQSNWYTYDVYSQKMFLLLLNSCMNSNELWIGPLAPLSVFTATEIIKSIYSYYTVLVEVM